MRRRIKQRVKTAIAELELRHYLIISVGIATFFFGFAAGALLNLYFIFINHPLVHEFRAALSYKSAIIGDGIVLPVVNMLAVSFMLKNKSLITPKLIQLGLFLGFVVTAWFHVNQAVNNVVNWAMPEPWQWNALGVWHAIYMYAVCSLLSLFGLSVVKYVKEEREVPREAVIAIVGVVVFFMLLRLDYIDINIASLFPNFQAMFAGM